jgi:zinc protease
MTELCVVLAIVAASPAIERHPLKNGLEVLVVENHALPLVTVELAVKNGSMTEPPEFNGVSHLYEHMFFKANAVLPNQEAYMARARQLGMQWNGTTNTEMVNYFFTTTSDHTGDAMVFMRDAILSPLFDVKELERERVVVTGEIDRNESNPNYYLWHEVNQHVWFKYPSRKDPLGSRSTVLKATPAQLRTIQSRFYVPGNSVLIVTGDVKAADVFAQADTLYATWKKSEDPFKKYPLVAHPPLPKSEVVIIKQPVETVSMMFTWHGPSTVGKNVELGYAADLLSFAVQEPSSKFQRDLVDSGACVAADFTWSTQRNVGPVTLMLDATPDQADACVKAALAELPRIKEADYLSDAELKNAAFAVELTLLKDRERGAELAHILAFWWTSAGLDYYLGYLDNMRKITRPDIARYVDTYVLGKPFVFGAMVSPQMIDKQQLDQKHFATLVGVAK